jgi:hypothetical protein
MRVWIWICGCHWCQSILTWNAIIQFASAMRFSADLVGIQIFNLTPYPVFALRLGSKCRKWQISNSICISESIRVLGDYSP